MRPILWTDEKVAYLRQKFGKMSNKALAERLEVTKKSLLQKATSIGLQSNPTVSRMRQLKAELEAKQKHLGWNRESIFYRESNPVRQIKCVIESSDLK